MRTGYFIGVALVLALAGCHKGVDKAAEQKAAAGQILQGSASDAMLPYDTVKSHPPLAPRVDCSAHEDAPDAPTQESAASEAAASEAAAPASDTPTHDTPTHDAPTKAASAPLIPAGA